MKWNKDKKNVDVPLNQMHPNKANPRSRYNKDELKELKLSLLSMGQLSNCIIDEDGTILSGHRRHFAANEIGWPTLKCDIRTKLSKFQKSAIIISANVTQSKLNAWESRDAISRIYWDEFLEEYVPSSSADKGYSAFGKFVGLSGAYIKKIVEATRGKNKGYLKTLRKHKIDTATSDEILASPAHLKPALIDEAIKRKKASKGLTSDTRLFKQIKGVKRRHLQEEKDELDKRYISRLIADIEVFSYELTPTLIKKSSDKDLIKLCRSFDKNLIPFYMKLKKRISN